MASENVEFVIEDADEEGEEIDVSDVTDADGELPEEEEPKPPSAFRLMLNGIVSKFCIDYLPFLVQECKFGNQHWRWHRICKCAYGTLIDPTAKNGWHGGVLDLLTGYELHPCVHCHPQVSPSTHQWALTNEEEHLVDVWRAYRAQVLDGIEQAGSAYRYDLTVKLNGVAETFLMSRQQTHPHQVLGETTGLASGMMKLDKGKSAKDKPN